MLQVVDLPELNWESIDDPYERCEKILPFYRIDIEVMFAMIKEAEKKALAADGGTLAEGVKPYVTLESLRAALHTDAWSVLEDRNTTLSKVLLSDQFKDGQTGDKIDAKTFRMFSLLHCISK